MAATSTRTIHVKSIAGEKVTLPLQQDSFDRPGSELVEAACNEIGLPNHKEFSFATLNRQVSPFKRKRKVWKASNDGSKLLNPKKSLKAQGIREAETLTLTLRRRLFFAETTRCCHDAGKKLDLTYLQLQNAISGATGVYSCAVSCNNAIKLAALQCCTEDKNVNIDGKFIEDKLNSLLPRKYAKVKGIASTVLEVYNSLDQELKNDSNKAKSEYIQHCTTLDGFGITFFSGKEPFKSTKKLIMTKQKLVKCYLGITHDSVWRVEANSCEVLEKWPIASIIGWNRSRSSVTLQMNNDKGYVFCPSGECDAIIQLLDDYAAIGKRLQSEGNSVANKSPIRSRVREDLADGPRSYPSAASISESESINCSSPPNRCTNASVARTSGDSDTDPSSENPPTEREIRSRETDSDTLSIGQDSATDPSSENPPTDRGIRSREANSDTLRDSVIDPSTENPPGTEGGIRSTKADTNTPNVSVARQVSSTNPINDSETNSAPAGVNKNRDSVWSETGASTSSEEESPIHDIQERLTLTRLRSVKNRIWEARSKWRDIGLELKLEITDLDAINGSDTDACFEKMLSIWLKQGKTRPTWSKMIKALKSRPVGFQQLAQHIEMNSGAKQHEKSLELSLEGMIESDEESQEGPHLEGRLKAQTRGIIVEFNILKCKLFDTLERHKDSVPKLAEYLEDYHAENLTSFDDVKKFIKRKSSFYDYEIVNHIIGVAGTEGDKERLHQYEKQFEAYAKHQFRTPSTSPTISVSQISFKLDSEYRELQDDRDKLMQFQYRLCNLLKLPMSKPVCIEWLKAN